MPAATKKKRKWAGLVCPVCRFVFRVPKDHEGSGVICPACHYLLNIPAHESKAPPARLPAKGSPKTLVPEPRGKKTASPVASRPFPEKDTRPAPPQPARAHTPDAAGRKRVRRHKKQRRQEAPEWESAPPRSGSDQGNTLAWIAGGSLLGLAAVGIGAWLVIGSAEEPGNSQSSSIDTSPASITVSLPAEEVEEVSEEEKKRQKAIADSVKAGMNALANAEDVVRKFLTAKTIDDLEPLIRTPGVTMPRIRRWYAEKKWTPPGANDIGCGGRVTVKGNMASMSVRLGDYSVKQIALENTPDGYKVDWESWVAWSSVPWDELFEKRPVEPVEVRVKCSRDFYYNRLFSDDKKWQAVRLINPGSDKTLYGYVDRDSPTFVRFLGELRNQSSVAVTLTIRYPKDTIAKDQVYISEYLQSGWVRPRSDSKPAPQTEKSE